MKETATLEVSARQIIGKQVSQLRKQGLIPATVYGPTHTEPLSVQVDWKTLRPVLLKAGGREVIELQYNGEAINVMVRDVQRHPTRGDVLHLDFYAVDVNATTRVTLQIHFLDSEAAAKRLGTRIIPAISSIEVEALPRDLPEAINVDLNPLKHAGDQLTVGDLPVIPGVKFITDADQLVVQAASVTDDDLKESQEAYDASQVEVIGRKAKEEEEE